MAHLADIAAAEAADPNVTPLVCSQCGHGHYRDAERVGHWTCTAGCGHSITWWDVEPECDEEVVVTADRRLAIEQH